MIYLSNFAGEASQTTQRSGGVLPAFLDEMDLRYTFPRIHLVAELGKCL